jgi:DNA-binding transcriptional LysR family regulator
VLSLDVNNCAHSLALLNETDKDLAIIGGLLEASDLVAHPFMENPLVVVASPTDPLRKNATFRWRAWPRRASSAVKPAAARAWQSSVSRIS